MISSSKYKPGFHTLASIASNNVQPITAILLLLRDTVVNCLAVIGWALFEAIEAIIWTPDFSTDCAENISALPSSL